jgi:hypothetical protein
LVKNSPTSSVSCGDMPSQKSRPGDPYGAKDAKTAAPVTSSGSLAAQASA